MSLFLQRLLREERSGGGVGRQEAGDDVLGMVVPRERGVVLLEDPHWEVGHLLDWIQPIDL